MLKFLKYCILHFPGNTWNTHHQFVIQFQINIRRSWKAYKEGPLKWQWKQEHWSMKNDKRGDLNQTYKIINRVEDVDIYMETGDYCKEAWAPNVSRKEGI